VTIAYLETSTIYCGDNLEWLARFPGDCIDLIYLDPPFFSNRFYEVIWGDEAEVRSFEDRWEGGIHVYIEWMRERMLEMRRVLKDTGSVYLHCDWHACHYLKVMMDEVFGANHFQNEFIWYFSGGGASKKRWARKHQNLLFYTKGNKWTFNADAVRTSYKWTKGQRRADGSGRDLEKGKLADDVWEHHGILPWAKEWRGYPTQKPGELLQRIILASSNKGDVVLDPFAGCGTALVAAHQLGRQWVGIDISPTAASLMGQWLQEYAGVRMKDLKLVNLPTTEEAVRALKPFEFQNWVINRFHGTYSPRSTGDMGIDGLSFFHHRPIQVKQSEHVGRNVVDNFETAVQRSGKDKGYIVAFSFTKGAYEEAARVKASADLVIELVTVANLLKEIPDLGEGDAGQLLPELPLPFPRSQEARPSVEELVESEAAAGVPALPEALPLGDEAHA